MNDWNNKKLGFGLMRLPKDETGAINIPAVCELADAFLAAGFTYFDSAYVYAGSEEAFREAVVKRHPRESFTIASKMAAWQLSDTYTAEDMFNESLRRCGVDYFDYYLLHSLQPSRADLYDDFDCWEFCKKMKAEGKIKKFGFSFHGDPELLEDILTKHPETEFVQLQINYVDWDSNAIYSGDNYKVCEKFGKDVVVMEPVKGGFLAELKPEAMEKLSALGTGASAASYALRFAGSLPNVKMVLSGMNAGAQMEDNMNTFANFVPLNDEEKAAIQATSDIILSVESVPCTSCRYCTKGCPMEINIPEIFKSYNMLLAFGEHNRPHFYYNSTLVTGSARANACIECGQCEAACPQHIEIIRRLKDASALLDQ